MTRVELHTQTAAWLAEVERARIDAEAGAGPEPEAMARLLARGERLLREWST